MEQPLPTAAVNPWVTLRVEPGAHCADRATPESIHVPVRPGFDCARCDEPWPCAPAKTELAERYQGNTLGLSQRLSAAMAEAMEHAVADHDWGRVDNLYDRFLGWIPRDGAHQHAPHHVVAAASGEPDIDVGIAMDGVYAKVEGGEHVDPQLGCNVLRSDQQARVKALSCPAREDSR